MNEPLAPDEDEVFRECTRLDGEPDQIPAGLYAGFLELMANSCNLSLKRANLAAWDFYQD